MLSLPRYSRHSSVDNGHSRNNIAFYNFIYIKLTLSKQDVTGNYTYCIYQLFHIRYYTESYIFNRLNEPSALFFESFGLFNIRQYIWTPFYLAGTSLSFLTGILSNLSYDSPSATSILLSEGLSS